MRLPCGVERLQCFIKDTTFGAGKQEISQLFSYEIL